MHSIDVRHRLNGLLELKIENERLQQRLKAVRARVEAQNRSSAKPDGHQQHAFRQASFSYGVPDQLGCDSCLGYPSEERTGNASGSKPRMSTSQEDLDEVGVPRKKVRSPLGHRQYLNSLMTDALLHSPRLSGRRGLSSTYVSPAGVQTRLNGERYALVATFRSCPGLIVSRRTASALIGSHRP